MAGYSVAGKTGTAQKPGPGGYQAGAYVASFAGFVPASAPRLSAIVMLDEPTPYYGGIVAAPVFAAIGSFGIRHFGIPAKPGEAATAVPTVPAGTLGASPTRP